MKLEELKMYLVRNSDGQYYRRVGYGGYGACWTDDVARASVWTKQSTARARVSYFANNYPNYPVPNLIEIAAGTIAVHDETARIEKAKIAKARAEARYQEQQKKRDLERAQRNLVEAQRNLRAAELEAQRKLAFIQDQMKRTKGDVA